MMMPKFSTTSQEIYNRNMALLGKIYQSFEALEETLGQLQLEEPLFMTYAAKKAFARKVLKNPKRDEKFLKSKFKM